MRIEDIPWEVQEVLLLKAHVKYVSGERYKRIEEVIEKYPEYFPWEHNYKTIPKEVHEKYSEDLQELNKTFYPEKFDFIPGEGLVGRMKRMEALRIPDTRSTKEILNDFFKNIEEKAAIKTEYQKKKKELWNKHYSIYKLKYRD